MHRDFIALAMVIKWASVSMSRLHPGQVSCSFWQSYNLTNLNRQDGSAAVRIRRTYWNCHQSLVLPVVERSPLRWLKVVFSLFSLFFIDIILFKFFVSFFLSLFFTSLDCKFCVSYFVQEGRIHLVFWNYTASLSKVSFHCVIARTSVVVFGNKCFPLCLILLILRGFNNFTLGTDPSVVVRRHDVYIRLPAMLNVAGWDKTLW